MKILMVASEMAPLVKTGGLADVVGALPLALAGRGHEVVVALPFYGQIAREKFQWSLDMPHLVAELPVGRRQMSVWSTQVGPPNAQVTVRLFDDPALFHRPQLYAEGGREYPDNALRFGYFCQAALWMLKGTGWIPDVIHCHDWQAALVPIFQRFSPAFANDPELGGIPVLFSIHNLSYQGLFPAHTAEQLGLPPEAMRPGALEYWGGMNLMKGALLYSDWLSTVSPTYAREIQTPEFGCGLEGVIQARAGRLTGILNGIDAEVWNPASDPLIASHFKQGRLAGKLRCKLALQERMGLKCDLAPPLMGIVSRLVDQKGFDLLAEVLPAVLRGSDAQLAVLGTGQPEYEKFFADLAKTRKGQVGVMIGFDNALAHQIEAGADLFLMPSQFEPCGLNQMYSLRYGTVPVVRKTGGLADTIVDATAENVAARMANGFVFEEYTAAGLQEALGRALAMYRGDKRGWRKLMDAGMGGDNSWERAAEQYERLMEELRKG